MWIPVIRTAYRKVSRAHLYTENAAKSAAPLTDEAVARVRELLEEAH